MPTVGESIVASPTYLAKHAKIVKSFVQASLQGWADAKKDPKAAAASMVTQFPTAGSQAQMEAELAQDLKLVWCAGDGATHIGPVSNSVWNNTATLLKQSDLLDQNAKVSDLVDQSYAGTGFASCSK
ncbi:MAG: ABC transporter substrate-binding protein [Galbitalea sp.]